MIPSIACLLTAVPWEAGPVQARAAIRAPAGPGWHEAAAKLALTAQGAGPMKAQARI